MVRAGMKDRLADAFIAALHSGTAPGEIRIRTLTEACAVDRQTFYYHFANIHELSAYAYDRELSRVFDGEEAPSTAAGWKERVNRILSTLDDQTELRSTIAPMLGEEPLRKALLKAVASEVERVYLPRLEEAGLSAVDARQRAGFVAYLLEAVLTGWITGELDEEVPVILDHIEEMLLDYAAGVELRLKGGQEQNG